MTQTHQLDIEKRLTFAITGQEITQNLLQKLCEQVFLRPEHMDVTYIILSRDDHKRLSDVIAQATNIRVIIDPKEVEVSEQASIFSRQVSHVLNQTTGTLMNLYSSTSLPDGTAIFGTYHDNSAAPTLSREDILAGKF